MNGGLPSHSLAHTPTCPPAHAHTQIFVKYMDPAAATVCKDKIHGRLYGGQLVQVGLALRKGVWKGVKGRVGGI